MTTHIQNFFVNIYSFPPPPHRISGWVCHNYITILCILYSNNIILQNFAGSGKQVKGQKLELITALVHDWVSSLQICMVLWSILCLHMGNFQLYCSCSSLNLSPANLCGIKVSMHTQLYVQVTFPQNSTIIWIHSTICLHRHWHIRLGMISNSFEGMHNWRQRTQYYHTRPYKLSLSLLKYLSPNSKTLTEQRSVWPKLKRLTQ